MEVKFTRDNINFYLNELAKEIKKTLGRKADIELIVVGGSAIILNNHTFRDATMDIDYYETHRQSFNEAKRRVADKLGLPDSWINTDFMRTSSYSDKLHLYTKPYKCFCQVLNVRTVKDEYLVAMKLKSMREYKHDISDIAGLIQDNKDADFLAKIEQAVNDLYGGWENIGEKARRIFDYILKNIEEVDFLMDTQLKEEKNRMVLLDFEKEYPHTIKEENLDSILNKLQQSLLKDERQEG